jgi:hypothetical protein
VAKFARKELARVISEGIASPTYDRFVNGRQGAVEESYQAPGAIVYEFTNWPMVIAAALDELKKRGPGPRSGRFNSSYVVIAGGRAVVTDFTKIRADAEVIITNFQPYVRKAEVGYLGIPEQRLFKGTARVMASRFKGAFRFEAKFLNVRAGIHPKMPYKLKVGAKLRLAVQNNRSSAYRAGRQYLSNRNAAGQPITYPSIIINPVS